MDHRTRWAVAALSVRTLLSPLNSSMIAIALVPLRHEFGLDAANVTWVVTVFYVASATGQPLMGRLADRFGPRRVFVTGMTAVALACGATSVATTFPLVCAGRVALALAAATAFPSAVISIRPLSQRSGVPPSHLLGRVQIANTSGAAVGPVLGGLLETLSGWQALFLVNIPLAVLAGLGAWLLAPADAPRLGTGVRVTLTESDLPGVGLFAAALVCWMTFLLDAADGPPWWLMAVAVVATTLFGWREMRTATPFLDLSLVRANRALATVYLAFILFNLVFYLAFFGMPQVLQERGHYQSGVAGLLMFPLAAVTIVLTPLVAKSVDRHGIRAVLRFGALVLTAGAALLTLGAVSVTPWLVVATMIALGVPYCIVNLALTQALYGSAKREDTGVASGVFQASRYVGAVLATTVLGITLSTGDTAGNWAIASSVAVLFAVAHLVVAWTWQPPRGAPGRQDR
ncbi:MFS transporter [Mycolicibacterium goodii]|uniref:MFS transporter n=1 Tax=Mycolicibacterium goodii TaxID=134601 RepID=UPI001C20EBB0|nr:MFS transporter [Mycolicibacterium goodii]